MIEEIKSIRCTCNKCGYSWIPNDGIAPKVCTKCKSYAWNDKQIDE
jgi:predicted Zn-ribbon and HTH transcriptional regulator